MSEIEKLTERLSIDADRLKQSTRADLHVICGDIREAVEALKSSQEDIAQLRAQVELAKPIYSRRQLQANLATLQAEKEMLEKDLAEIRSLSAEYMEDTGQAYCYVGIRDYAAVEERAREQASQLERLEKENEALRAALEKDQTDAERWRALMSSQRMHFMGCAGIELVNKPGTTSRKTADLIPVMKPGEYQHFGMEFWSEHKAFGNPEFPDDFERSLLVAYVDNLRAARALSTSTPSGGDHG